MKIFGYLDDGLNLLVEFQKSLAPVYLYPLILFEIFILLWLIYKFVYTYFPCDLNPIMGIDK